MELDGVTPAAFNEEELFVLMITLLRRLSNRDPLSQLFNFMLKDVWFQTGGGHRWVR